MNRYVVRRVLLGIITVIGVSIIVFIASRLSGDVALLLAPPEATMEDIQALRAHLGLDKPIPVQYLLFAENVARGDFGESIRYKRPVLELLANRLGPTLELTATAFFISIGLGVLLGTISATSRGSILDQFCKIFGLLGQSMPGFWVGLSAILIFAVQLHWLPTGGHGGINHLILPASVLAWFPVASLMRLTRSSMLDVLDSEYVKLARVKGAPERAVIWKHALRNALVPVAGLGGVQLAQLIGGAVIIETIFSWPGIGSLIVDAIFSRDYPLVQGGVLLLSTFCIFINLSVDLLYGAIDPRIRYD